MLWGAAPATSSRSQSCGGAEVIRATHQEGSLYFLHGLSTAAPTTSSRSQSCSGAWGTRCAGWQRVPPPAADEADTEKRQLTGGDDVIASSRGRYGEEGQRRHAVR